MGCGIIGTAIKGGLKKEGHPLQDDNFTNSIGMEFKRIPAGNFLMGSLVGEKNRNADEGIRLAEIRNPFYLGIYEVTQAQWRAVMGNNPSYFTGVDRPVEQVSWNDVSAFINKLNAIEKTDKYRLPTETEWEYACRSGTTAPFSFGNCLSTTKANYNGNYPYSGCLKGEYLGKTLPVGSLRANAFGLYDMHGNVVEWRQDRYDKYFYLPNPSHSFGSPTTGAKEFLSTVCPSINSIPYSIGMAADLTNTVTLPILRVMNHIIVKFESSRPGKSRSCRYPSRKTVSITETL